MSYQEFQKIIDSVNRFLTDEVITAFLIISVMILGFMRIWGLI